MDENKIFLLSRGELEGRLDAFYYKKEFRDLEALIRSKTDKKLLHFAIKMAGGATPDKKEAHKYYTDDRQNGIPFLRVQNIKSDNTISDDFIFINKETHEGMLKRSQIKSGDLVTKITGVGRMAISAVVPYCFRGNINQHSVVIKTENRKISEAIATFLNSDIGEKLSSRRSTGGTRPALDYQALKGIPIIFNQKIASIFRKAVIQKRQKEQKANELLGSIDSYLLDELGILLPPEPANTLENRVFEVGFDEVFGGRYDCLSYTDNLTNVLHLARYTPVRFVELIKYIKTGFAAGKYDQSSEDGILQIRPTNIDNDGNLIFEKNIYVPIELSEKTEILQKSEILFNNTNSQELVGKSAFFDIEGRFFCSNHITRIKVKEIANPEYIWHILNLYQRQKVFFKTCVNWNNQSGVNIELLKSYLIPLPPLDTQAKIANEIKNRRDRAKRLQTEAKEILESAKKEVEKIILGEANES